jgi:NitT/TauT family transport system substrate-binding protein
MKIRTLAGMLAMAWGALGIMSAQAAAAGTVTKPAQMTPITLRMHWVATSNHAGFVVALDKGWYKERNLDVKILDGRGSVATVQTVGAGNETFGYASLATMIIGRKDLPVTAVATVFQKSDIGIMVPIDSSIKNPRDLNGKTIIYTAGSFEVPFLPVFFQKNGVDPQSVRLVSIAGDAKYTQYIVGQGDALAASAPALIPRAREKRPSRAFLLSDYGVPLTGTGLFTTVKVIQEKPEVVRAFVDASLQGLQWAFEHTKESMAILKKYYPDINEAGLYQQAMEFKNYIHTERTKGKPLGVFLDEEWKPAVDTLVDLKLIPAARPLSDYYTNEFLPAK